MSGNPFFTTCSSEIQPARIHSANCNVALLLPVLLCCAILLYPEDTLFYFDIGYKAKQGDATPTCTV